MVLRALAPGLFLGIVILSAVKLIAPESVAWIGVWLAAGATLFALTTLVLQHRRRRHVSDVTVDYWRLAMTSLLLVMAIWAASAIAGRPMPAVLLGVLFLAGFVISAVCGMSYKIVPFLVWLHLNNRIFTYPSLRGRVPNMKQVIPERQARWQFRLHVVALVFLAIAAATGDANTAHGAGGLFALSGAWHAYNLWGALLLYVRLLREGKKGS
jgi:hypothetical protein